MNTAGSRPVPTPASRTEARSAKWASWSALAALGLLGAAAFDCGGSTNPEPPEAGGPQGGGICCPLSPKPGCCMEFGGWHESSLACGAICDGIPTPDYPGWEVRVDAHGCAFWWKPADAPNGCGIAPSPDGGPDVDASIDRTESQPETGTKRDAEADTKQDVEGGLRCCPISPTPACCMQYGGSVDDASPGRCLTVCDGMPGPGYPGWEKRIDGNGCPYWWTPPNAPNGCGVVNTDVIPSDVIVIPMPDVLDVKPADDVVTPPHDAIITPDVIETPDAPQCCPISDAPACCMQYGGFGGDGGWSCATVCDGMPNPGYPGWERRIDAHGCPYWWTPANAPAGCGANPPDGALPPFDAPPSSYDARDDYYAISPPSDPRASVRAGK